MSQCFENSSAIEASDSMGILESVKMTHGKSKFTKVAHFYLPPYFKYTVSSLKGLLMRLQQTHFENIGL